MHRTWIPAALWATQRRRIRQQPRKIRVSPAPEAYGRVLRLLHSMQVLPPAAVDLATERLQAMLGAFARAERQKGRYKPSAAPTPSRARSAGRALSSPARATETAGRMVPARSIHHAAHGLGGAAHAKVSPTQGSAPANRTVATRPGAAIAQGHTGPEASYPKSRASAVYHRVFASYLPRIAAVANDPTLTPEQRKATLAALHLEQQQTAEAAMERELNEERAFTTGQKIRRERLRPWQGRSPHMRRHV
jgi:hypothetical protein